MLRLIIETCVHRRAAAIFATLVVALFGLRAYLDTPIEAYPDVTNTQVTVITQHPGNAPEEIERRITVPLERELNGTPGMTLMRRESLYGLSLITMTFSDDTDSFPARTMVLQRVAVAALPEGVTPELAPEATPLGEVYPFRLSSDRHDLYQMRAEMEWIETFIRLKPHSQWRPGVDKDELVDEIRASLSEIPGVRCNFSQPMKDNVEEAVSGVRGKVVLEVFGADLDRMRATLEEVKQVLKPVPGIVDLDLYRDASTPQLQVRFDRQALARAGIPMEDAQRALETALAGRVATQMFEGERPVPVRVILPLDVRDDMDKIAAITLVSDTGARVPLRDLTRIEMTSGLTSINREGNSRYRALKFNVEGRDMGSVVTDAMAVVADKVKPPEGHYFVWGGEFENQQRAVARLKLIVPVAVLLVLVLLYGAMNSGRSALAILLTVPFAMVGGVFALLAAGVALSVSAAVGFIALLGQISLMGVLVLSAAETRRRSGEALLPALTAGAADRMRPVLMAPCSRRACPPRGPSGARCSSKATPSSSRPGATKTRRRRPFAAPSVSARSFPY